MGKNFKDLDLTIKRYLKEAKTAFDSNKQLKTITNIANALNVNPDDERVHSFLKEIRESLNSSEWKKFNRLLNGAINLQGALRDQGPAEANTFKVIKSKESGLQSGHFSEEISSKKSFMVKRIGGSSNDENLIELLSGDLYKRLIYGRAPSIALVKRSVSEGLSIRSKILSGAVGLSDFLKEDRGNLRKINGFEKVMAACQLLGERDFHTGNLMVRPMDGNPDRFELLKIDHGRSLSLMFKENRDSFQEFIHLILIPDQGGTLYRDPVMNGELIFNIHDYVQFLKSMLVILSDEEVKNVIQKRIDELKKSGFDVAYDPSSFIEHLQMMRGYSDILEKISKQISENPESPEKKALENGGWLNKLDLLLKDSTGEILTDDKLKEIVQNFQIKKSQSWDEETIERFFDLVEKSIIPNTLSEPDFKSILLFLKNNPTENLEVYSKKKGKMLIEYIMERFGHTYYESDLDVISRNIYPKSYLDFRDGEGNTVAMNAVLAYKESGDISIIKVLLHSDLSLKNDNGKTIIDLINDKIPAKEKTSLLIFLEARLKSEIKPKKTKGEEPKELKDQEELKKSLEKIKPLISEESDLPLISKEPIFFREITGKTSGNIGMALSLEPEPVAGINKKNSKNRQSKGGHLKK